MSTTCTIELEAICCFHCQAYFGMSSAAHDRYYNNHKDFHCPYCQGCQSYNHKTKLEKEQQRNERLQRQLERSQKETTNRTQQLRTAERKTAAQKGVTTKLKKRIAHGVCPCCSRTFSNVQRHIDRMHPTYKPETKMKLK